MPIKHKIKQGEDISSLAANHGLFPETIWEEPSNAELKEKRSDMNVLYPGDIVFIPDKEPKEEFAETEQRHRFRKKGVPSKLRFRLMDGNQSRAHIAYTIIVDDVSTSGVTDSEGKLELSVTATAKRAVIFVENEKPVDISLGELDPIDTITGAKARLFNLGYNVGKIDDKIRPNFKYALRLFQKKYNLKETEELNKETQEKLNEIYRF